MPDPADTDAVRVSVWLPHGDLPRWLGAALLEIDALPGVALRIERHAAAPIERLTTLDRWWRARVPLLQPWRPDGSARERLAAWQALDGQPAHIAFAIDPGAPASAHVLGGAGGDSLWRSFPLLESITGGAGIRLGCWQRRAAGEPLRQTHAVHVAASARYAHALAGLATALRGLVAQVLPADPRQAGAPPADSRNAAALPADSRHAAALPAASAAAGGPAPFGRAAPTAGRTGHGAAGWGLRGRARAWVERQRALWLSERWRIGVIDAPLAQLTVPGPLPPVRWITREAFGGYWADPFGVPGDPRQLACEHFDEHTGLGQIDLLRFDATDRLVGRTRLPLGAGRHVSFPNMFEIGGRRFGLPETVAARECVLYEVDAAGTWRPLATLLQGVAAADPAMFEFEGRCWLAYTDLAIGAQDNLCLQHAPRPEGPWQPHARNPVKLDITGARMAGGVFRHAGALYRPAQDCLRTYGAAVVLHRIVRLTPDAFDEVAVRRFEPDARGPCPHGLHTLTAWGDRTLLDGKRHRPNPIAFGRKFRQSWAARVQRRRGAPMARAASPPAPLPAAPAAPAARAAWPARVAVPGSEPLPVPPARRVFVYLPHLRVGGGEISMLRLAQGFAEAGLAVDLVVHTLHNRELDIPPGVNVVNLDSAGTVAALRRLVAALRQRRPQWLLSAFAHTNVAAVAAAAMAGTGTRCIVSEHAPLTRQIAQQGGWRYRLLPPLVRWAYRRADAVVAVSEGVRADLQSLAGPAVAIDVIRNPVLPHDLHDELAQPPDHAWLLDASLEVVLSVCRLSVEKDLPTLVRAFAQVRAQRPAARLLVAGEGPDRPRIEALVAELGLTTVVCLPGRTGQPLRWMHRARVFVLASTFEGFGNVLVEALACGTPVVSTDCPVGPRELLEGGRFGRLVPVGDAAAMAGAIVAALEQPGLPPGAREAAQQYTLGNAAAAYLRRFESLAPPSAASTAAPAC